MSYRYKLHPKGDDTQNTYSREELERLTTIQLREICRLEKIVVERERQLDREYLIEKILHFRGKKAQYFIWEFAGSPLEEGYTQIASHLRFENADKQIQIPERLVFFTGTDKTVADGCLLEGSGGFGGNILLLDEQNHIRGILNQIQKDGKYYLTCSWKLLMPGVNQTVHKKYKLGFLEEASSIALYQHYYGIAPLRPMKYLCAVKMVQELLFVEEAVTPATLAIDFGTSNTAAGAYIDSQNYTPIVQKELEKSGVALDSIHKVLFHRGDGQQTEMVPTVLSVKSCLPGGGILCRFGYDARENAVKNSFGGMESCFYDMKKWVNSYHNMVEVYDEEGNFALVSKKELLYQYFQFIIGEAQRQHKCRYQRLHITCPVKQKSQYLEMFEEVLGGEYHVETSRSLDEGVAVLYHTISNQIQKESFDPFEKYHALIIDCGGGTTDLTSCRYTIGEGQITYRLDLETVYANGDVNFGGNNITFRIFQYLKVLFAKYYQTGEQVLVQSLIGIQLPQIYEAVDSIGLPGLYAALWEAYEAAEQVVPTKYFEYRDSHAQQYNQVRSNFYFLWNLAERMKVDFYQGNGAAYTQFHQWGIKKDYKSTKIVGEESWRLNILKNGRLELETALPQLLITKEEMNLLIAGDVYGIVKKFLEPLYVNGDLNQMNLIKLTGQTCRIELFRDALKEFIPGKMISSPQKENTEQYYKLTCVEGAIQYENAKKIGLLTPYITNSPPRLLYELTSTNFKGEEITLLQPSQRLSGSYGFVSRSMEAQKVFFWLKDSQGNTLHKYQHSVDFQHFRQTTYEEMGERAAENFIRQEDVDDILDSEMKLFAYCNDNRWGFSILPVARKDGILYIGEARYYPFENGEWELDFFDGRK